MNSRIAVALAAFGCLAAFIAGGASRANGGPQRIVQPALALKQAYICGPPFTVSTGSTLQFSTLGNVRIVALMPQLEKSCGGPGGRGDSGVTYLVWYQG
jgi:hypothetical protein